MPDQTHTMRQLVEAMIVTKRAEIAAAAQRLHDARIYVRALRDVLENDSTTTADTRRRT